MRMQRWTGQGEERGRGDKSKDGDLRELARCISGRPRRDEIDRCRVTWGESHG